MHSVGKFKKKINLKIIFYFLFTIFLISNCIVVVPAFGWSSWHPTDGLGLVALAADFGPDFRPFCCKLSGKNCLV